MRIPPVGVDPEGGVGGVGGVGGKVPSIGSMRSPQPIKESPSSHVRPIHAPESVGVGFKTALQHFH